MIKDKLKLILKDKENQLNGDFLILNDVEASSLFGGCDRLRRCINYMGPGCGRLRNCGFYDDTSQ